MIKEVLNICRKHIWQPELHQIDAEDHIRKCGGGNFKTMSLYEIREENKILRKSYETYFIKNLNLHWIKDTSK